MIYIIFPESCDNYTVHKIFTNKEIAEEELARLGIRSKEYCIEEYETDPPLTKIDPTYEKGNTYKIVISKVNGETLETKDSIKNYYRHPELCVVLNYSNPFTHWITVISPINTGHAIVEAVRQREKWLQEFPREFEKLKGKHEKINIQNNPSIDKIKIGDILEKEIEKGSWFLTPIESEEDIKNAYNTVMKSPDRITRIRRGSLIILSNEAYYKRGLL